MWAVEKARISLSKTNKYGQKNKRKPHLVPPKRKTLSPINNKNIRLMTSTSLNLKLFVVGPIMQHDCRLRGHGPIPLGLTIDQRHVTFKKKEKEILIKSYTI